jgi:hypothetical protein
MLLLGVSAGLAQTPSPAATADDGQVTISVNNQPPKVFGRADIRRLPHTAAVVKGMDGRSGKFSGVALYDLLAAAGMDLGGEQRPAALTTYLWVEGKDGYRVLFSGAEIHRYIGAGDVLLVDSEDGQAIAKPSGTYRLVVAGDKVRARWIRQVRALYVVQAVPPVSSAN